MSEALELTIVEADGTTDTELTGDVWELTVETGATGPPGIGGEEITHGDLPGRNIANQHPASAIDVDGTPLTECLPIKVAQFVGDIDVVGGDFTMVPIIGGATIPRVYLVGQTVLVTQGPNVATVWTVTTSGPCIEGDALIDGTVVTSRFAGQTATISATDGSTLGVVLHDPSRGTGFRPWSSRSWILLGNVEGVASYFSTTEFSSFSGAFETRAHLVFLLPDPADTGEGELDFWEYATQELQAAGGWGDDQDNNEDAGYYSEGRIGVFNEQCQTDTPIETVEGEHAPSRIYSLDDAAPSGDRWYYKDPTFELHLGDEIVLRKTYEPDYDGVWRKVMWRECSSDVAEDQTTDGRWWRRIIESRGTTTGSFQSSNQPWHIGLHTGGLFAIRWEEVYDGIDDTLVLHFDTDDLQGDGTVESSVVLGQTWTPTGNPLAYDPSLVTLAELLAGGGTIATSSITGVATARILGRTTSGTGTAEELTASQVRTLLGLVIGTDVQAYNADLAAIAGLTSAADKLPYYTGSNTAALATLTSFARTLLDDADAATALSTLGRRSSTAGSDTSVTSSTTLTNDTGLSVAIDTGTWHYRAKLWVTGDSGGDLDTAVTTPANSAYFATTRALSNAASSQPNTPNDATVTSSGTRMTGFGTITSGTVGVTIEGTVIATASGNIQIQHSQRTSNGTATTVKAGSYIEVWAG